MVKAQLALVVPAIEVSIEIIKTTGDVKTEPLSVIGGKGIFTKELEDALLDNRIDIAVHSLKDLPTIIPRQLVIAAICQRHDPHDALVLRGDIGLANVSISGLAERTVVGTSSARRLAQLKHLRQDIVVKDLRGNVDTRLRKLDEGQYDALILASAGLHRLGLASRISVLIPTDDMLPAPGQGAIAIETRAQDYFATEVIGKLDHQPTRFACTAERALLRALGGGCQLPIAAYATVSYQEIFLKGLVADSEGRKLVRGSLLGPIAEAEDLGAQLAGRLWEQGANRLLAPSS